MTNEKVHILIDAFQNENEQELRSFCYVFAEEGNEKADRVVGEAIEEWTKTKKEGRMLDLEDAIIGLSNEYIETAFAVGFLYGQEFSIVDPEARKVLERVRKRLIREGILKFTAREKAI